MVDYRYLKAFLLTAQFLSFSKAAQILKIAQSAVSRQIKLLEESVGEELILRSSKKILLTHKGQELYLASLNFDKMALDIFQKEDTRPMNVGILHGLLETWCNPVLIRYYKKYQRNMNIHIGNQPDLRKGLESGLYDLIFTTENIQSDLLSSLYLFDEHMVLISKKEVNTKKLHAYRWIVYGDLDNIYKLSKTSSNEVLTVDSITTIVNLVKNQLGIAVVPDHVLKPGDGLKVYEMPELKKSEIYMATLNYKTMPKYLKEIAELVMPEVSELS
ncbi:MAG: LysR family transcriptional regulator [Pseudomonadota bacterium]